MATIQLTYTFHSEQELLTHLAHLVFPGKTAPQAPNLGDTKAAVVCKEQKIAHADLPGTGTVAKVTLNEVIPGNGFGAENPTLPASSLVKIPFGLSPESIPAPSTAAAAQAPTAPAAPSSTTVAPPAPPAPAPLSAPAAGAPTGTATPQPPVAGAELDKHGLPWDGRIHADSKGKPHPKNADGAWRIKKNLDGATKTTVEAELRQLMALNAGAAPLPSSLGANFPGPLSGAAPPAPPVTSANPMGELMAKLAPLFAAGKLSYAQCDTVVKKHGVDNLTQLVLTPNLVPAVEADLMALVA